MDAASEFKLAPPERHLSRLNKVLVALIAAGTVVPFLFRTLPVVKEKASQDASLAAVETELEETRMLYTRLTREVYLLQNDPEYMSIYARDQVSPGYRKEGETIFRFPALSQP
jgi:cell division protein FtsB